MRVAVELERIDVLDRQALISEWRQVLGTRPAKNLSSIMMQRVLAYEYQCSVYGGLSGTTKRALGVRSSNKPSGQHCSAAKSAPMLSAGTQLAREWNGRTYRVEVTDKGFAMDGKTYRSLTAIAKRITGAHWSGPRFFGLKVS